MLAVRTADCTPPAPGEALTVGPPALPGGIMLVDVTGAAGGPPVPCPAGMKVITCVTLRDPSTVPPCPTTTGAPVAGSITTLPSGAPSWPANWMAPVAWFSVSVPAGFPC